MNSIFLWGGDMGQSRPSMTGSNNLKSIKTSLILFLLFMSAVCICLGAYNIISNQSNSLWIIVDGFILSSDIETHVIMGESDERKSSIFYNAVAEYQYTVNGQTYVNHHFLNYVKKNDPSEANAVMMDHPEGAIIRIAYNPESPSESRIVTASQDRPRVYVLTGILFLLCALLAHRLINVSRSKEKNRRAKTIPGIETKNEDIQEPSRQAPPSPKPQSALSGTWKLDYQIPSMREIISFTQKGTQIHQNDRHAVLSTKSDNLTVTITEREIEFKFKDEKNQGSCDILSRYLMEGNTLTLDHQNMDFLMVDIEDFPPTSYTFTRNGSKLTLTSGKIKGLDNRQISYHLSLAN